MGQVFGSTDSSNGDMKEDFKQLSYNSEKSFEKSCIQDWTKKDITSFLEFIDFNELNKTDLIREIKTGEEFLKEVRISNQVFDEMGSQKRNLFYVYLRHLQLISKDSQFFHNSFHVILKKIQDSSLYDFSSMQLDELDNLIEHITILCDKKKIHQNLLGGNNLLEVVKIKKLKIRLIIAENTMKQIGTTSLKDSFVDKFSIEFNDKTNFGNFSSAVTVGPYLFEWNKYSLLIPKRVIMRDVGSKKSKCLLLNMDIDPVSMVLETEHDILKQIAEIVEKWNLQRIYKQNPKNRFEVNSQGFVREFLSSLDVDMKYFSRERCVLNYLKEIEKTGFGKVVFKPGEEFSSEYKLSEYVSFDVRNGEIEFDTHTEIDDFIFFLVSQGEEKMKEFKSEFRILKAFDRAFWVRYFQNPSLDQYKPSKTGENRKFGNIFLSGCYFCDPNEKLEEIDFSDCKKLE